MLISSERPIESRRDLSETKPLLSYLRVLLLCMRLGERCSAKASWLDDDEETCKALEQDIHALAMLIFVEWRAFVSALPGCGGVLSRETSALWLAQASRPLLIFFLSYRCCF